jgi:GAF domain-containing protein
MRDLPPSALEALLRITLADASLSEILQRLAGVAKDSVPGADEISITLVRGDRPYTAAYTGQLALDADEMQYARGYGPCIDAGLSGVVLAVDDMRKETRWPDYAANVVRRGVLSSLSVPLPVQIDVLGALDCYARTPSAFRGGSHEVALQVAGYIGVAVANAVTYSETAQLASNLQTAMVSRAVIEQAKGIIMAQNRCDADKAFDILRRASMGRNVKLRELAAGIVAGITDSDT